MLPEGPVSGAHFKRLRTLVLNASGATWQQVRCFAAAAAVNVQRSVFTRAVLFQVCRLQPVLPALVELHMCNCGITSLAGDGALHLSLRVCKS